MKAFIISVAGDDLGEKLSQECIEQAKKFNIDVKPWAGVNGRTCAAEKFKKYGIKNFLHKKMVRPGVQGCFLSHFELWNHCVKENDTFLVLEHDGYFIRNLPVDVENKFSDILNLDPFDPYNKEYDQKVKNSLNENIEINHPVVAKSKAAGEYIGGSYGYLIKPHAAQKLIDFAVYKGALPSDSHMGRKVIDLKATTVPVVRLHPFFEEHNIKKYSTTKLE